MSDICTRFLIHFHLFRFYQMNSYVHKLSPAREMLFWSKKKFNFWKIYRFFRKRIFISSCFTLLILWKVNLHSFWKWGPQGSLQNLYFHKSLSLNLKILWKIKELDCNLWRFLFAHRIHYLYKIFSMIY